MSWALRQGDVDACPESDRLTYITSHVDACSESDRLQIEVGIASCGTLLWQPVSLYGVHYDKDKCDNSFTALGCHVMPFTALGCYVMPFTALG